MVHSTLDLLDAIVRGSADRDYPGQAGAVGGQSRAILALTAVPGALRAVIDGPLAMIVDADEGEWDEADAAWVSTEIGPRAEDILHDLIAETTISPETALQMCVDIF